MGVALGTLGGREGRALEAVFAGIELTLGTSRLVFELEEASSAPTTPAPGSSGLSVRFDTRHAADIPSLRADTNDALLRSNYEKLRAAFELARAIGPEMNLEIVLARIVDASLQIFSADAAGIVLFGDDDGVAKVLSRRRDGRAEATHLSSPVLREVRAAKETV